MILPKIRFVLVVPNEMDIVRWRLPLIEKLIAAGIEVLVIAPKEYAGDLLEEVGCRRLSWNMRRSGIVPWKEIGSFIELYHAYRRWRPVLVHHFTIKPNIYGSLCGLLAGVPITIASVTGLGYLWTDDGMKTRIVRILAKNIYRLALRISTVGIFLNEADRRVLGGKNTELSQGEGIDLEKFHPFALGAKQKTVLRSDLEISDHTHIVMLVGRMLWHKGIKEYVESALLLKRKNRDCVFFLVGPIDKDNPSGVSESIINNWQKQGLIRYLGERKDVRDVMSLADVIVLPSYREGLPVVLMEAASLGKALIATDVPGCRDVVQDGINGFLVSVKNPGALATAIEKVLLDSDLRAQFQIASRRIAEEKYGIEKAVNSMLYLYSRLMKKKGMKIPSSFESFEGIRQHSD